eukprot:CAMPEP_0178975212 /NCGR_PEP_ID=MMETSP0789-20121207/22995_1 /TAXON_ID=3005 /ORGANISM="Rhizosolenia setigera, Strain CCMP 1694" /LENGTH=322 /DNA_ID=CAMNT_0020663849 /DNA_START=92 /DNA_END=1060 /DNA_ORIENTATION=-
MVAQNTNDNIDNNIQKRTHKRTNNALNLLEGMVEKLALSMMTINTNGDINALVSDDCPPSVSSSLSLPIASFSSSYDNKDINQKDPHDINELLAIMASSSATTTTCLVPSSPLPSLPTRNSNGKRSRCSQEQDNITNTTTNNDDDLQHYLMEYNKLTTTGESEMPPLLTCSSSFDITMATSPTVDPMQQQKKKTKPSALVSPSTSPKNDHLTSPPLLVQQQQQQQQVYTKKDFSKYMVNWLKENWTNPYPDEYTLNEIAALFSMEDTKEISNWLINARTRKWRPAIKQAYEMNKNADFLLEDSIRIFEESEKKEKGGGTRKS